MYFGMVSHHIYWRSTSDNAVIKHVV